MRAVFAPHIADAQIEFRLAKIDPNGKCTEGINRINSTKSSSFTNVDKSLSYWPANKYMNIWLVNTIGFGGGTVLGYAQFPSSSNLLTYGVVCKHNEWGSLGNSHIRW